MENQEFENMSNMECWKIYSPACYYSVIRGGACHWVSGFSVYKVDEKARRAALVSVLSVRHRLVFNEAMVFAMMPADLLDEIKNMIRGKSYEDFGLEKRFTILGNDEEEVELEKIPSVTYVNNVDVLGKTDKVAYQDFCYGKTSFSAWGSIVQFAIPEVKPSEYVPLIEVDDEDREEEVFETAIQGFVDKPEDVLIVVPQLSDVVKQVGWLGATSVQVDVTTPEQGKKTVDLYGDTPSIIHFKCLSTYVAKYKHTVSYSRKWVRNDTMQMDFEDSVYEFKFRQVFKKFMSKLSRIMLDVRKKNGGWSRLSRRLYDILRQINLPVLMPSAEVMALSMCIVNSGKIFWKEWFYSWYNGSNIRYWGYEDFAECLANFPGEDSEIEVDWSSYSQMTYNEFESFAKYTRSAGFSYYDDDMINEDLVEQRQREMEIEDRGLDDVCFIDSEEFPPSDYDELDYFERGLLGD